MIGPRPASRLPYVVEAYMQEFQPGPEPRLFQSTYVYDRNGLLLAELFGEGRRNWVSLDQISPHLIEATVSTEDATFYTNLGVDPLRVAAAAVQNLQNRRIVSGASTITMQLARLLFLGPEKRYDRTFDRKLLEVGLSQELTSLYTKDELLEMYLNLLNYGNLTYGPEAAARVYFNKSAADLTLSEATFLAGIPQQPAYFDPYRNFSAIKDRQRLVLDLMVRHLRISQAEADAAYDERLVMQGDIKIAPNLEPHFVQYLEQALDARLGEGYMRRSGWHITSSLDYGMQAKAREILAARVAKMKPKYNMSNGALVAMRPGNGEVLVMVGSVDFSDASISGQVNVALSPRQPGSSIKPLLFATALSQDLISPATVLFDTPVAYDLGNGSFYEPRNYDNRFHGLVTARTALANSYNIPSVKLLNSLGVENFLESAGKLGLETLIDDEYYGLGLALGANEVTLMEMANAYHTMANQGSFEVPEVVVKLLDSQYQSVEIPPRPEPVQALTPAAAYLITDILSDNIARSPTFGLNSSLKLDVPAAAKTGTTTDWRDNWTMGYTRHLLAGVWTGNSDGSLMRDTTGASGAAPIWKEFMQTVISDPLLRAAIDAPAPEDAAAWEFEPVEDVVKMDECPPQMTCRAGGEYFSRSWLEAAGEYGPLADSFVTVPSVSVYTGQSQNHWLPAYCEQDGGQVRTLLNLASGIGLPGQEAPSQSLSDGRMPELSVVTLADNPSIGKPIRDGEGAALRVMYFLPRELEWYRTISWGLRNGRPVNLGLCEDLHFYTIQAGDHWGKVAERFGVSVRDLQTVNGHLVRGYGVLVAGDRMIVPQGVEVEIGSNGDWYTVGAGDTWSAIAKNHDLSLGLLQAVNPEMLRPYLILRVGDELYIPPSIQ